MVLSALLCVLLTAQTTMAGQQMRFDDEKDVFFSAGAAELSYGGTMPSFELRGGKESFKVTRSFAGKQLLLLRLFSF